ncbi:MAG: DNA-binding response regulator [Bacteroidetes bacterium]|nr:MAG: DNA-binding response regulator [Bacteroidota bacterium]
MIQNAVTMLLVEPDENLGQLLKSYLEVQHHRVTLCKTVDEAFEALKAKRFEACLIEVNFPNEQGFRLVSHMRDRNGHVPIMILSSLTSTEEVIKGLRAGADDYLRKPFEVEELMLRFSGLLRRAIREDVNQDLPTSFEIGKFHFDVTRQQLTLAGNAPRRLTTKESELLRQLAIHKNELLTREHALHMVWSEYNYSNARSMDVYITKLRKILSDDPDVEIVNIRGQGFKLVV